jgi:hypothetical protein
MTDTPTPKEAKPTPSLILSPDGGHIAENSWRLHEIEKHATALIVDDGGLATGLDRDYKDDLLTTAKVGLLSSAEAGAREIPKP